jgi:pSer/pThr/pTyr-binding forkhead associated (FHA) protein
MAASFSLIIEDDAGKQIVVPFSKDVITIGRKEGNTIRLTERNVSRFHAKLMKENGGIRVEDLSSFNGIKLNGDRISGTAQVSSGDVIEIGDYHLELRAAQTASVGPVGSKSVGVGAADTGRDEFEGETQRWEAPAPQAVAQRAAGPAHGGFGGEGGDTERLDMGRLQALASGGQMAQPPPGLPPPQSWPAPTRPMSVPPPSSMLDLEPTARQPIADVPIGGAASPPPPFNSALNEPTQDLLQARPLALRDLIADPGDTAPVPSPSSLPPMSTMPPPAMSMPAMAPPAAARPAPRRNFEETEQLRAAPGAAVSTADDLAFPRLIALNTIFAGLEFPLKAMENVLGRTDDNDIVIEHRSISRNHAKFVRQGERVQVLDLKSANGVLVNGNEVDQHTLRSGDVVELGRVKLRFVPVGERFALASDEVERARLADHGGEEFDDAAKTTMVQHDALLSLAPKQSRPIALYAVLAVLAIVVVVLAVLLFARGGGQADATTPSPADAATTTASATSPEAAPPTAPTTTGSDGTTAPKPAVEVAVPAAAAPVASPDAASTPPSDPTLTSPRTPVVDATAEPAQKALKTRKAFSREESLARVRELYGKADYAEAIVLLKEVEQHAPRDAQIKSQIALYYAKNHDTKNALFYFNRFKDAADPAEVENLRKLLARNGINAGP